MFRQISEKQRATSRLWRTLEENFFVFNIHFNNEGNNRGKLYIKRDLKDIPTITTHDLICILIHINRL